MIQDRELTPDPIHPNHPGSFFRCARCKQVDCRGSAVICDDGQALCSACANKLFGVCLKPLSDNRPDPNEYGSWEELMADEAKIETIRLVREALYPKKTGEATRPN